jgi:hypothetical protein
VSRFGTLSTSRLQLLVIGPSYGESLILGVPGEPTRWLVVDSLLNQRAGRLRQPVREALADLGATPDLVLLTHAHADHAGGMARLIEACPTTTKVTSAVEDYSVARSAKLRDAAQRLEAAAALRSIRQLPPERRWGADLVSERLGEATVTILHPSSARRRALLDDASAHPNLLSSPVKVDWRGRSILLAADLERDEWEALDKGGELVTCNPAKVPHHGSPGAFDEVWAGSVPHTPADRTLVVTPFNRRPKLPDLDNPKGIPGLLERVLRVHLTCPPFRPNVPLAGPVSVTELRNARDAAGASRARVPRRLGTTGPADGEVEADRGWVRVELSDDGRCTVTSGPASVVISAGTTVISSDNGADLAPA